jgi:Kef-type K+ transport system membrane component KefB
VTGFLLPPASAPFLGLLAQFGVVLYMFLVGLDLDRVLRRSRATITISHASIVVPFLCGSLLALFLYPRVSTADVPFAHFALFCGIAMSVTAFPVLARIPSDRGAHRSWLGLVALSCAAIDDVTAWCLLAFVTGLVHADGAGGATTALLAAGYVAAMATIGRPLVARLVALHERRGQLDRTTLGAMLAALLLSALATEAIGVHALFGAFVLGALVPADSRLARELTGKLEEFVVVLFLPVFFACTGMRTQIGLLHDTGKWLLCALIVAVACIGKFGGTVRPRDSTASAGASRSRSAY